MDPQPPSMDLLARHDITSALQAIDLHFELWEPSRKLHRRIVMHLIERQRLHPPAKDDAAFQTVAQLSAWIGEPKAQIEEALVWLQDRRAAEHSRARLGRSRWRATDHAQLSLGTHPWPEHRTVGALRIVPDLK